VHTSIPISDLLLLAVPAITQSAEARATSSRCDTLAIFFVLESDGQTSTLQRATPNPVATVALAPTLNPTLGITGWQ
jgi:hypothetical protein